MTVDITLYKDKAAIQIMYTNGVSTQWIDYPAGTKEMAIDMIDEWYRIYKDVLAACNIKVSVHNNDYFSAWDGK